MGKGRGKGSVVDGRSCKSDLHARRSGCGLPSRGGVNP